MIIYRYISREILVTLLAVMAVLVLIFVGNRLVGLLAIAGEMAMPGAVTLKLLLYNTLSSLIAVMPLAVFLAVMLGLGRLYKDSEMDAMMACGVSIRSVFHAVTGIGVAVALIVAIVSLFVSPWAEEKIYQLRDVERARDSGEHMVAGRFLTFDQGAGVIYAEGNGQTGKDQMHNVFIQSFVDGHEIVLYASKAYYSISERSGARYLLLEQGYRYDYLPGRLLTGEAMVDKVSGQPRSPGGREIRVTRFDSHAILIPDPEVSPSKRKRRAHSTWSLLASDSHVDSAELQWRLSIPIGAFLLVMLAVPLSRSVPRQGRYSRLLGAILVYVIYSNLLGVAYSWIVRGVIPPALGLWWVHALMIAVIVGVMMRQYGVQWVMRSLLGRQVV